MISMLTKYFRSRKVSNSKFVEFMTSDNIYNNEYKLFTVNNQDYIISHFLDSSNIIGHSLIKTNEILKTNKTPLIVFATTEGDDVTCLNIADNSIWLWCVQSDNGKFAKITDSFDAFIQMIIK